MDAHLSSSGTGAERKNASICSSSDRVSAPTNRVNAARKSRASQDRHKLVDMPILRFSSQAEMQRLRSVSSVIALPTHRFCSCDRFVIELRQSDVDFRLQVNRLYAVATLSRQF